MKLFNVSLLVASIFVSSGGMSAAQDGGLYEDVADPNAAFVRVIASGETVAIVQNVAFRDVEDGITPYVVTEPGDVRIVAGGAEFADVVQPAKFYTYLVGTDGVGTMLEDDVTGSPAQADVTYYNISDAPITNLFVPQANAVALNDVKANSSASVALKAPLTLTFEVRADEAVLATVADVDLKRRAGVTIIFSGTDGDYSATVTENRYVN